MQWIKSHLTVVICGTVSFISVTLVVLGIVLPNINEVMAQDVGQIQRLSSIRPVNERVIASIKKIRDDNEKQVQETLQKLVVELGDHKPLHPDVFPNVNPLNQYAPFQFKHAFSEAMHQLIVTLNAKDAPAPEEVTEEATQMEAQRAKAQNLQDLGVTGDQKGRAAAPRAPAARRSAADLTVRREDMTPEQMAAELPEVRVSIRRAREIYCYAHEANFDQRPAVTEVDRPTVDEMWYAQMAMWIEQDVVGALAGLNKTVAERLAKVNNQQPWVGNLPVKHVIHFTVGGYLPPQTPQAVSGAPPSGLGGMVRRAMPMGPTGEEGGASFTQRGGTSSVDIIHFSLDLIIEARMLPSIIDEVCKAGFYTPLLVSYETVEPNLNLVGYIYGPSPSIHVQLQFEGCFLRAKYEKLMPETVKTAIQEGTAQGRADSRTGGAGSGRAPAGRTPGGFPGRGGGRGGMEEGP